jgi:hypothetical protein
MENGLNRQQVAAMKRLYSTAALLVGIEPGSVYFEVGYESGTLCQPQNSPNACFNLIPGLRRQDSDPLFQARLMKRTQRFTFSITGGAKTGLLGIVGQLYPQWTWLRCNRKDQDVRPKIINRVDAYD